MSDGAKLTVHTDKETLLLGSHFHVLEDETKNTFNAFTMNDLLEFIEKEDHIFIDEKAKIEVYNNLDANYNKKPIAKYELKDSTELLLFKALLDHDTKITDLANNINMLKDGFEAESEGMKLLDALKDLKIRKVVNIDQKDDQRGNFNYSVQSASGDEDFQFPESFDISLRRFDNEEETVTLKVNLTFNWHMVEQQAIMSMKLKCLEINRVLKESLKSFITDKLGTDYKNFYFGSYTIAPATNDWKYKENSADL